MWQNRTLLLVKKGDFLSLTTVRRYVSPDSADFVE